MTELSEHPMHLPLLLADRDLACGIAPALGGCIVRLQRGGVDVLRAPPAQLASARQAASYPLVPWSNRIADAVLRWRGREQPLERNNAPEPHAIHGTGWQDAWEVVRHDSRQAELRLHHRADGRWPFAFEAMQRLHVGGQALELSLAVTNRSPEPMPAGLGWHPFFVKRPGARLRLRSAGRWEMSAAKLPTHRVAHPGFDGGCDALEVDHCFDGWDGTAELEDAHLRVTLTSSLRHAVVFTTPQRETIAIEPVSHVNNVYGDPALAAQPAALTGARELAPGETMQAQMRIEVRPAG